MAKYVRIDGKRKKQLEQEMAGSRRGRHVHFERLVLNHLDGERVRFDELLDDRRIQEIQALCEDATLKKFIGMIEDELKTAHEVAYAAKRLAGKFGFTAIEFDEVTVQVRHQKAVAPIKVFPKP